MAKLKPSLEEEEASLAATQAEIDADLATKVAQIAAAREGTADEEDDDSGEEEGDALAFTADGHDEEMAEAAITGEESAAAEDGEEWHGTTSWDADDEDVSDSTGRFVLATPAATGGKEKSEIPNGWKGTGAGGGWMSDTISPLALDNR